MLMFLTIVIAVASHCLAAEKPSSLEDNRRARSVLGLILGVVVLAFVILGLAAPS